VFDKFGKELKLGDKVIIEAEVVALYHSERVINLKVRLLDPRPTDDGRQYQDNFYINPTTVRRRNP